MVVTTAWLFRLKPEARSIDSIRKATSPTDVADELPWTWCYHPSTGEVLDHNHFEIDNWKTEHKGLRWRGLEDQLAHLWTGLHWALVVNINSLGDAVTELQQAFADLPKDFSRNRELDALMRARVSAQRKLKAGKRTV
jgi:hypothetical protein